MNNTTVLASLQRRVGKHAGLVARATLWNLPIADLDPSDVTNCATTLQGFNKQDSVQPPLPLCGAEVCRGSVLTSSQQ